ncbi:Acetophenone carboxylase gamma subunit (plasmid) [Variovorax sp. SRS16]|uniref:hydantoinase/oxoprolinase family protein n=1 Tax=Variovorax sp. SRS16 TaxID=282217 RepID=UPI00131756EA|nr:hydantoinase/oxoprolinase family protein [Variovorax sp. SRS16]VTU46572.1 Acetophenone carboxylase gamma subunit [Variovorax sp. SRS16]
MIALSADVGGTFTDLVIADGRTGATYAEKVLSTPGSSDAICNGIERLARRAGVAASDIDSFVHGFTIATNAWLTRSGARVALAVTAGFRDVLEIGTQRRPQTYSLTQQRLAPLVPRSRVIEVDERTDSAGQVVRALSAADAARAADAIAAVEPEAVAVCLLFSHLDDTHERLLLEALRKRLPDVPVYLSSVINPQIEEYPRANTTVTAAYVGPAVDQYIGKLERALPKIGVRAPILMMRSDGGVSTVRAARDNPASMLLSGPAGGVIAGQGISRELAVPELITFDMGGTSADFSLLSDGQSRMANERLLKGEVLRIASLDIQTISAGGGSIGWVDLGGAIRVGPTSAGSVPGPACYGLGGEHPTLTDAALITGLLNADEYLNGEMQLDLAAARRAIDAHVAQPLGVPIEEAAFGMLTMANVQMAQAIRGLSVERGYDVRNFALLSFGGAGSIFAPFLARDLGMSEVLIPLRPGVLSAEGLLLSDIRYALQKSFHGPLEAVAPEALREAYKALRQRAEEAFARDEVAPADRDMRPLADLRFQGQMHELTVEMPAAVLEDWWSAADVFELFRARHEREFGFADAASPAEIVNVRIEAVGRVRRPQAQQDTRRDDHDDSHPGAPPRTRDIYLGPQTGWVRSRVMARSQLREGDTIPGPLVVNQPDTTVFVLPQQSLRVAPGGILRIRDREVAQ